MVSRVSLGFSVELLDASLNDALCRSPTDAVRFGRFRQLPVVHISLAYLSSLWCLSSTCMRTLRSVPPQH